MWRVALFAVMVGTLCPSAALAQQPEIEQLRSDLATLKKEMARIEALLLQLASRSTPEAANAPSPSAPAATPSAVTPTAPAMNTPSALPAQSADYIKMAPRFDVLMQVRADAYDDAAKVSTFRLRKAEIGIKGHIARGADYSIELDPVKPSDPLRRTYLRLMPHNRVHIKLWLEKAPLGLEELTSSAQIPFVDRSEVSDRFSAAEELGIHVESRWSRWMWQLSVTNGGRRLLLTRHVARPVVTGLGDHRDDVLDFFLEAEARRGGEVEGLAAAARRHVLHDDRPHQPRGHAVGEAVHAHPARHGRRLRHQVADHRDAATELVGDLGEAIRLGLDRRAATGLEQCALVRRPAGHGQVTEGGCGQDRGVEANSWFRHDRHQIAFSRRTAACIHHSP